MISNGIWRIVFDPAWRGMYAYDLRPLSLAFCCLRSLSRPRAGPSPLSLPLSHFRFLPLLSIILLSLSRLSLLSRVCTSSKLSLESALPSIFASNLYLPTTASSLVPVSPDFSDFLDTPDVPDTPNRADVDGERPFRQA